VTLTFDISTLKVVSESRVTWANSVPILVFLGLSVLDLDPLYATDVRRRETSDRQTSDAHHRLMLPLREWDNNTTHKVTLVNSRIDTLKKN